MARLVKCVVTGVCGNSSEFHKVGTKWYKDRETYLNYLKNKDISYEDILNLLIDDRSCIVSPVSKRKIIDVLKQELI